MAQFVIRGFEKRDREAVRRIAWDTAFLGSPADAFFSGREFFEDFLTGYFTDCEPESCFVAEKDGEVAGYLLGTTDTERMGRIARRKLLFRLLRGLAGVFWRKKNLLFFLMVFRSSLKGEFRDEHFPGYPATFHINMKDTARGMGAGSALVDAYISYLRQRSVHGVFLCTMSGAGGFFEKKGFRLLADHPRSYFSHVNGVVRARIYGRSL